MIPTGDYKRFEDEICEKYSDITSEKTYGILLVDPRQDDAKQYIINYLELFDEYSGEAFDFFIPGLSLCRYDAQMNDYIATIKNEKYYFSIKKFFDFIKKIQDIFEIEYTYNPMLILLEKKPGIKPNKNDKKIIIELDLEVHSVRRSGILFKNIFEIAKKEVAIEKHGYGLRNIYIKKHILDKIIKILDNKVISFLKEVNTCTRKYRII